MDWIPKLWGQIRGTHWLLRRHGSQCLARSFSPVSPLTLYVGSCRTASRVLQLLCLEGEADDWDSFRVFQVDFVHLALRFDKKDEHTTRISRTRQERDEDETYRPPSETYTILEQQLHISNQTSRTIFSECLPLRRDAGSPKSRQWNTMLSGQGAHLVFTHPGQIASWIPLDSKAHNVSCLPISPSSKQLLLITVSYHRQIIPNRARSKGLRGRQS